MRGEEAAHKKMVEANNPQISAEKERISHFLKGEAFRNQIQLT